MQGHEKDIIPESKTKNKCCKRIAEIYKSPALFK